MHTALRPVLLLLEDIGTPRSLTITIMIRYEMWEEIARLKCDPKLYLDSASFRKDYAATDILRKCADLPTGIDTHLVAVAKWCEAEKQCLKTNLRLEPYLCNAEGSELVYACISHAKRFIKKVLGPIPPLSPTYDFLSREVVMEGVVGRFGPGATYSDTGLLTTVADKMSSKPTWTNQAWEDCKAAFLSTQWAHALPDYRREPEKVRHDRFVSVPKDALTKRGISIQPSGNVFYQLAHGRYIRNRLRSQLGWNLNEAQEIHKAVARQASLDSLKATIDLSSASDTVATSLVKLLLPSEWFDRLTALRTTHTRFNVSDGAGLGIAKQKTPPGGTLSVRLEKFSAMGNGYTFELETLLFASIVQAVYKLRGNSQAKIGKDYFVYGDDIIVDTEAALDVISALRFFGFTPNERKTFVDGCFRESCGGDYFNGQDVRPVHIENLPKEPHEYIAFANSLRRLSPLGVDAPLRGHWTARAWRATLDCLPSHVRSCVGPARLGDIVIHDVPEAWQTRPRTDILWTVTGPYREWRRKWIRREVHCGYFEVRCWKPVKVQHVSWKHFSPEVILACATYGSGNGLLGIMPRKPEMSYGTGWTPC